MELITGKLSLKDMGALMVQHIFLFEVFLLTVSITSVQVFYLKRLHKDTGRTCYVT